MNMVAATKSKWIAPSEQPARIMENVLRSGALAKAAGVNIATLRFYERKGLLPKPPRSTGGYREYSPQAVRRLEFIGRAKGLGFSLTEIKELLELRVEANTKCADVRTRAHGKLEAIRNKVAELKRFERGLKRLMASCSSQEDANTCPILDYLDGQT